MKSKTWMIVVTLSLSGACGGSAQMMRTDAIGGQLKLEGAFMPAMAEARVLMAEHCQGRFRAVEQQDSVAFRCETAQSVAGSFGAGRW